MSGYQEWIAANVTDSGYGKCAELTQRMADAFPELRRARGFYHDPLWGPRTHWWCVGPSGNVVDPTAAQFPTRGTFEYEEIPDDELEARVPTGPCANCGEPCFRCAVCCSDECHRSYAAYVMRTR